MDDDTTLQTSTPSDDDLGSDASYGSYEIGNLEDAIDGGVSSIDDFEEATDEDLEEGDAEALRTTSPADEETAESDGSKDWALAAMNEKEDGWDEDYV